MINRVLLVGAGRRFELVSLWKERGYEVHIYENSLHVPAREIADRIFIGVDFNINTIGELIDDLASLSLKYGYKFILPCFDSAVYALGYAKPYNKIKNIVVSELPGIEFSCNKLIFADGMKTHFFDYYPNPNRFSEAVLKPILGYGSKGIITVSSEFINNLNVVEFPGYEIQRKLHGLEYSVDCYFNPNSKFVDGVSRIRNRVAGGEVISSTTTYYPELIDLSKQIGEKFKFIGPINFQFIVEYNRPYCIETNARFGGGFTFSIKAGLDVISLLERDYYNKTYKYIPNSWKKGLRLERSYRDHIYADRN